MEKIGRKNVQIAHNCNDKMNEGCIKRLLF